MMPTAVIVCGGRNYTDRASLYGWLNTLREKYLITKIITGGARGADTLAAEYAKSNNITSTIIPAKWDLYGKRAGYLRNLEMLATLQEHQKMTNDDIAVIAFLGGVGTKMMEDIAAKAGVQVLCL